MLLSSSRLSYQKLKKDPTLYREEEEEKQKQKQLSLSQFKPQERPRISRRIRVKKRWRFRVPRLRRLFKRRLVWAAWAKIVRRLKESQAHFGEIFAGNYLFLQVTPQALKMRPKPQSLNLSYLPSARASY